MANPTDGSAIKITAEDLAGVKVPESVVPTVAPSSGAKMYGTINETAEQFVSVPAERGSILLQGWFYLGLAGLLGALAGWGIAEPGFVDGPGHHWGNFLIIPLIVTLMCIGLGVSESIVERSARKALLRGALALPLGILLGFIFDMMAETVYGLLLRVISEAGVQTYKNPAVWIVRGFAWMVLEPRAEWCMASSGSPRKKERMVFWAARSELDSVDWSSIRFRWALMSAG